MIHLCFAALLAVLLPVAALAQSDRIPLPRDILDGFGPPLLRNPATSGFQPYGMTRVTEVEGQPVRFGTEALRFEVREGDCGINGDFDECARNLERRRLSQTANRAQEGDDLWFALSIYVPDGTQVIDYVTTEFLTMYQEDQNGDGVDLMNIELSVFGLRVELPFHRRFGGLPESETLVSNANLYNQWHDILFNIRFTDDDTGRIHIWVGRQPMYVYDGPTLLPGYQVDFAFGIERENAHRFRLRTGNDTPTQVAYFDAVFRGDRLVEVDRAVIADLQRVLADAGLYDSAIDGLWGPGTQGAVNAWRAEQGQPPIDGYTLDLAGPILTPEIQTEETPTIGP